jgi:hypothetical protein
MKNEHRTLRHQKKYVHPHHLLQSSLTRFEKELENEPVQ